MNTQHKLIPRQVLFGNPEKSSLSISPDGKFLSYLAPLNGVLNVYVMKNEANAQATPVTDDTHRGVPQYFWAQDSKNILYLKDSNGDENYQLYRVNVLTGEKKTLTEFKESRVMVAKVSPLTLDEIAIVANERRKDFFDVYKININTGEMKEIYKNDQFASINLDNKYNLRFATKTNEDGSASIYKFDEKTSEPSKEIFMHIPIEDIYTTGFVGFNKEQDKLYLIDSTDRNTGALFLLDLNSGKKDFIFENEKVDISNIILHPTEKYLQAVEYTHLKDEIKIFDDAFAQDYNALKDDAKGELHIIGRSKDDKIWLIAYAPEDNTHSYYKFNRDSKKLEFLFDSRPELKKWPLTKMYPVVIKSRDGLDLPSYISVPKDAELNAATLTAKHPVPLMIWVHGGPTARDSFGYNAVHQWLTNRGIAVLSVNYRGSTGFGKNFINAGNGEWSRKAHDDLIDAVNWAISHNITTKDKVAIGGGSYGGYAALVGVTFTPDVFACAVDIVGPSNLKTLLQTIPPYWKPALKSLEIKTGGSISTEEGMKELDARSPVNFVDNISKPLLIGQGANDPRVKQSESDQIVAKMKEKNIPVTYVLYPEEGHGFAKPENRMSFFAITEYFLHKVLDTQYEPITEESFKGANLEIKEPGKLDLPYSDAGGNCKPS